MEYFKQWLNRFLSNPEALALLGILLVGFMAIFWVGDVLSSVLASIVIAYLLEGVVQRLTAKGVNRKLSVITVFGLFLAALSYMVFGLLPLISIQTAQLAQQLPDMLNKGVDLVMRLPQQYPDLISEEQIKALWSQVSAELVKYGQALLSMSASSLLGLVALVIYLFLVPLLVFFFLMDKDEIVAWFTSNLPSKRQLSAQVWGTVNLQIANYVRGKVWEIFIVWAACFTAFSLLGLDYAMLLSFLVGLSVLIPYVGATVVTIPVILVAYVQWGGGSDFVYLVTVFLIIQALDGYVLVPLLFSEVVNIHPVAIIVAILFFGGVWGFWGVFFAIPLATLVQAVMVAWPREAAANPSTSS
ncbi:MAG: AI-2E family transporter [Cycloclasticus sp. symbiont of Poecilosclerida sp. M]|nr:MAG: AI-2E family transporter [Cycloclasticus sp. symbiont of Poecilosclerida sp. M]